MSAFYTVNFSGANNEDLRQDFVLSNSAGTAVDLTGASLKMQIETLDETVVLDATTGNGRIAVTAATEGRFQLAVPASVMRTLTPGMYRHDLLLVAADDSVRRVWTGTLTLAKGVTE